MLHMSQIKNDLDNVINYAERLVCSAEDYNDLNIRRDDLERQYETICAIANRLESDISTVMLADDVGMGKTYVALGVIAYYMYKNLSDCTKNKNSQKFLIVTPQNNILKTKWLLEIGSFFENAGIKESAKKSLSMNPVLIERVDDLLKLSEDKQSRDDYKNIREHSDVQMLFTETLFKWARNNKKSLKGKEIKIPSYLKEFGPYATAKEKNNPIYYISAYSVMCEYSLLTYFERMWSESKEKMIQLLNTIINDKSWWLLNKELKCFLAHQDVYEPNIHVMTTAQLKPRLSRTSMLGRIINLIIANHSLLGCQKETRTTLLRGLYEKSLIPQPSEFGRQQWCDEYFNCLCEFNDFLDLNNFLSSCEEFQKNKNNFRYEEVDLKEFLEEYSKLFLKHRLNKMNYSLCLIDEVHNWKGGKKNADTFEKTYSDIFPKKLIMSATPIQLGIHEMKQIFIHVCPKDETIKHYLDQLFEGSVISQLEKNSRQLKNCWDSLSKSDYKNLDVLNKDKVNENILDGMIRTTTSESLINFLNAVICYKESIKRVEEILSKFMIRHVKEAKLRSVHAGNKFESESKIKNKIYSINGLDHANDDMTIFECVSMRLGQLLRKHETGRGSHSTSARLLSGLNSSIGAYKESNSTLNVEKYFTDGDQDQKYFELHRRMIEEKDFIHPKVERTVERAYQNWKSGEKTLIFCGRLRTIDEIMDQLNQKISKHIRKKTTRTIDSKTLSKMYQLVDLRLFRIFLKAESVAISDSVAKEFLLKNREELSKTISELLNDENNITRRKLYKIFDLFLLKEFQPSEDFKQILNNDNSIDRAAIKNYVNPPSISAKQGNSAIESEDIEEDSEHEEPVSKKVLAHAIEEYFDDNLWVNNHDDSQVVCQTITKLINEEFEPLKNKEQIFDIILELFSGLLKLTVKRKDLMTLFLSSAKNKESKRSIIDGIYAHPLSERYQETLSGRTINYLNDLGRAQGSIASGSKYSKRLSLWRGTFLESRSSSEYVRKIDGSVKDDLRMKLCDAFNSPLAPDILICTSIGSEGIDLHRYCRNIIHHDIPWNPASLEQKTGRIDRVNSLAERMNKYENQEIQHFINIGIPFLANNYDQYKYDVLLERAQRFEILFGDPGILEDLEKHEKMLDEINDTDKFLDEEVEDGIMDQPLVSPLPDSLIRYLSIDLSVK